jgi:ubiquinone biosynthesis protein UbiJ
VKVESFAGDVAALGEAVDRLGERVERLGTSKARKRSRE